MILDKARFEAQLACREYEWHMLIKVKSSRTVLVSVQSSSSANSRSHVGMMRRLIIINLMCPQPSCFSELLRMKCPTQQLPVLHVHVSNADLCI